MTTVSHKIDFTTVIQTIEGEDSIFVLKTDAEGRPTETAPMTLRKICVTALTDSLLTVGPGGGMVPEQLDAEKSIGLSLLAREIFQRDQADLTSGEVETLKDRIRRRFQNPWIMTQAFALLDPASIKKAKAL